MADTTFISGVADGAFEKAFGELPEWASEETALAIENTLNKILGVQSKTFAQLLKTSAGGGSSGGLSKKDVEDTNKELAKLSKSIAKQVEDANKAKKQAKSKKDSDELALALDKKTSASGQLWAQVLVKLKGAGDAILKSQVQYFTTSNDLFKSGVNLADGQKAGTSSLATLQQIVVDTGLRLETFQKVVEQFSSSINAVGVNKFVQTLKLSRQGLTALGYSSEQQAQLIGTMLESESNYTDLRNKSAKQLTDDAERFGRQVTKLSLFTGQSVSKLQENIRVLSKSNEAWVASARLGPEAAKRLTGIASAFGDSHIQDLVLKFGSTMSSANEDIFKSLNAAGLGAEAQELAATFKAGAAGTLSQQETIQKATDIALRIQEQRSKVEALEAQRLGGNAAAGSAETLLAGLTSAGHNLSKATDPQVDAATKSQAALSRLSSALEDKSSLIQRTFPLLNDQVNLASSALELFNQGIKSATDLLNPATRSWVGVGVQLAEVIVGTILSFQALKTTMKLINDVRGIPNKGVPGTSTPSGTGGKGKWLGRAAKGVAGGVGGILAGIGLDYATDKLKESGHETAAAATDIASSAASMAGLGATLGSVVPILGTAAGAIVGGIAGAGYGAYKNWGTISPSTPKPSTIDSPSADSSLNNGEEDSNKLKSTRDDTSAATTNKSSQTNEVNSTLTYQTSVLTQILEASQNLVSVNREILKFTRARA